MQQLVCGQVGCRSNKYVVCAYGQTHHCLRRMKCSTRENRLLERDHTEPGKKVGPPL